MSDQDGQLPEAEAPKDEAMDYSTKDEAAEKSELSQQEIEKAEEAKLKARYPRAMQPMSGHSAFLQKRLAKGQKFFDSGDYQMAKQKGTATAKSRLPPAIPPFATGDAIPTPETVPVRKTSIIQQPKLNFNANS